MYNENTVDPDKNPFDIEKEISFQNYPLPEQIRQYKSDDWPGMEELRKIMDCWLLLAGYDPEQKGGHALGPDMKPVIYSFYDGLFDVAIYMVEGRGGHFRPKHSGREYQIYQFGNITTTLNKNISVSSDDRNLIGEYEQLMIHINLKSSDSDKTLDFYSGEHVATLFRGHKFFMEGHHNTGILEIPSTTVVKKYKQDNNWIIPGLWWMDAIVHVKLALEVRTIQEKTVEIAKRDEKLRYWGID